MPHLALVGSLPKQTWREPHGGIKLNHGNISTKNRIFALQYSFWHDKLSEEAERGMRLPI